MRRRSLTSNHMSSLGREYGHYHSENEEVAPSSNGAGGWENKKIQKWDRNFIDFMPNISDDGTTMGAAVLDSRVKGGKSGTSSSSMARQSVQNTHDVGCGILEGCL